MNKLKKILSLALVIFGISVFGNCDIYADNVFLSEEEVRTQIVTRMEKLKADVNYDYDFTPENYAIDKLYCLESAVFIINGYQDGKEFSELIEVSDSTKYWMLPYSNKKGKSCMIKFVEENGVLDDISQNTDYENIQDMKLEEGQFVLDEVEETRYVKLVLYDFCVTYVKMKDNTEYIIPYMTDSITQSSGLQHKKVYTLKEFFEHMCNQYDEPTLEELKSTNVENMEMQGGAVGPLKDESLNQKYSLNKTILYVVLTLGGIAVLFFGFKRKNKKV